MQALARLTLGAILVGFAMPASGQERPTHLVPTRDVAVTYRVTAGNPGQAAGPQEFSVSYLAAERKVRLDLGTIIPEMNAWGLVDLAHNRFDIVLERLRAVMAGPPNLDMSRVLRMAEGARMTRSDTVTIAGVRCTNWRFEQGGQRGSACLTDDGVTLRSVIEGLETREATRVAYAPQDSSRFRLPAGYQQMDAQQLMRALGAAPPQRR